MLTKKFSVVAVLTFILMAFGVVNTFANGYTWPTEPPVTPGAPGAPTNFTATPGDNKVTLGWTKVESATEYRVYIHDGTNLVAVELGDVNSYEASGTITGKVVDTLTGGVSPTETANITIENCQTYEFKVQSGSDGLWGGFSSLASATPAEMPCTLPGEAGGFGVKDQVGYNRVSMGGTTKTSYPVSSDGKINNGNTISVTQTTAEVSFQVVKCGCIDDGEYYGSVGVEINDTASQRSLKAVLTDSSGDANKGVVYEVDGNKVGVSVPAGTLLYFEATNADKSLVLSGYIENLEENPASGVIYTDASGNITYNPNNLIQKVRDSLKDRGFDASGTIAEGDLFPTGNFDYNIYTNIPVGYIDTDTNTLKPFSETTSFTANNKTLTNAYKLSGNVTVSDGKVILYPWTISGSVTPAGATITLTGTGLTSQTTVATNGTYTFHVKNGTYTLTPSLSNYTFTPETVTVSNANVTKNFTGIYVPPSEEYVSPVAPAEVASGTTVGSGESKTVPEGETVSDVTVEEGGTVTVRETSGLESPTISGTVENKGTIKGTEEKPAVIEETGIVKGGTLEGVIENKGTIKGTEENPVLLKAGEVSITVQEGADIEGIMKIETPSGIHTLNIPPEAAFPAGVEITPQDLLSYAEEHGWFASLSIPKIPSEYQLVGGLIVSPEGFKITEPATIIIPYDKTKIPSGFTKDDLLVLAVDPDSIDWVSVEVKEVTEDTVTIETDILSTYAVVVPVAVEYPTLKLYIRDLVDPSNKENVYHFTENVYDTRGTPHIYVNTIKTGTGKVDIYAKCTYPDGKSAWLYFDADGLVRFHDECAAEWSNITFDELTDYILIHGAWWFDKSKEAEWKLSMPTGEYTWKVIVVKHGGDIEKTEDIICESEAKLILEY